MLEAEQCRLPYAVDFVAECARRIIDARRDSLLSSADLSASLIVVPNPAVAPLLRAALAGVAGRTLLLPRILTLGQIAASAPDAVPFLPDSLRQLVLYRELKSRGWFHDGALWEICAELITLFDELTRNAIVLPPDEASFAAQLEQAYGLRNSQSLRFEAQVVHALWRAEAAGQASRQMATLQTLSRLAASASVPLYALCEGEPTPTEAAFFHAWARRQSALVFVPDRAHREASALPVCGLLNHAWPIAETSAPLTDRADAAAAAMPQSPLQDRVRLIGAASLEDEAAAVASEVRRWLAAGKRRIALVAMDRVAARRARALLERENILVEDETGWKLSTTRAAALVDAWLEVVAADAYHRDLLDLVKSPFVCADLSAEARREAVLRLESAIARHNLMCGLRRYESVLAQEADYPAARALLRRIAAARSGMAMNAAAPAEWLSRLEQALESLGAVSALEADEAGRTLLDLLRTRREELAGEPLRLSFGAWRDWLNRELETAAFVDRGIVSSVTMTHLAATRLRRFDAAIIIGADRDNLAPPVPRAVFGNQAVRAELGLPTGLEAAARMRDDLAMLIANCDEVSATWQTLRGGEANLLARDLATLSLLHRRAYGHDLHVQVTRMRARGDSAGTLMPAPGVAADRLPQRISASGYASLVACPYQFYARRVLGLAESEAVSEALEKRDYGEFVHGILQRFHAQYPLLSEHADETLSAALEALTQETFRRAINANFLEHAWLIRWKARIPDYIAWQREREQVGWRYEGGELARALPLPLEDGSTLTLDGRLDRLDLDADGREAVLDYKAQSKQALRQRLNSGGDDVQLGVYTILQGEAVSEAAYVALDEQPVCALPLDDPQAMAQDQAERLMATFSALRRGAPMPAHGVDSVCTYCEIRGLCRRDYHAESEEGA